MKEKKRFLIICCLLIVVVLIMGAFQLECPMKYFFGISCPGCGLSRSQFAMFHLDFVSAFYYHPLFFIPIPFMIWMFLRADKKLTTFELITIIAIFALFFIVYILRVSFHHPVTQWNFSDGLLLKNRVG